MGYTNLDKGISRVRQWELGLAPPGTTGSGRCAKPCRSLETSNRTSTSGRFREARLAQANLRYAALQGADLRGAILWGADLTGANLKDARLTGARYFTGHTWPAGYAPVASAPKHSARTDWPDGFDPKAAGAIPEE